MRRSSIPPFFVHLPATPEGKASLSRQVACAHAEQVRRYIQSLSCPADQKRKLAEAILRSGR